METLKVLVVDDEQGMRYGIRRALRNYMVELTDVDSQIAYQVSEADSGETGLIAIRESQPDILLLDYKLGGITGLDVLNALKEEGREVLTVMITAFASLQTAIQATKSGAFDFIAKPFTPDELKETICKATIHLVSQRQARKLAQEKRQVRFEFIRVLGHELKAPLAAIEGYLDIMKEHGAGDELSDYDEMFDRCMNRVQGMRKLILDLLDMTRVESGEKRRELIELDVCEIARLALDTVRPEADKRGIRISIDGDESVLMTGDRGEIEILFNNLLTNAVKYNNDGGKVDVTVSKKDDRVQIQVADTGIGMKSEDVAKLFKDFVRIKSEKTKHVLGTGLGLSLVKRLTSLYEGDVKVTSTPGEGSTFTVTLAKHADSSKHQSAGVPVTTAAQ